MKKSILYLSLAILLSLKACCHDLTFVSIAPAMTETIYALGAQDKLLAVSDNCSYPEEVKNKQKIGTSFLLNEELIIKLKPTFILAFDSSTFQLAKFKKFNITPLCFKYTNVEEVLSNIKKIAHLASADKKGETLVEDINRKIVKANSHKNKKILYVVQTTPMITLGSKSFITDVIKKSGNRSIGEELRISYPVISEEYAIKQKPDVIVLTPYADEKRIKVFFPDTKIVRLTKEQNDIINRPGPRIYQSVEFFSKL